MEADPDVAGAMDILSFALYHENNDTVVDQEGPPTPEIENQRGGKRARLSDDNESSLSQPQGLESPQNPIDLAALVSTIWRELQESNDEKAIKHICSDVADRDLVRSAIQQLEEQEKVMIDDEMVYIQ